MELQPSTENLNLLRGGSRRERNLAANLEIRELIDGARKALKPLLLPVGAGFETNSHVIGSDSESGATASIRAKVGADYHHNSTPDLSTIGLRLSHTLDGIDTASEEVVLIDTKGITVDCKRFGYTQAPEERDGLHTILWANELTEQDWATAEEAVSMIRLCAGQTVAQ